MCAKNYILEDIICEHGLIYLELKSDWTHMPASSHTPNHSKVTGNVFKNKFVIAQQWENIVSAD